jgi:hypothetical protein
MRLKDEIMAYYTSQQREALRSELKKLKFNQAKGRIRRLDAKGRIAFLKNSQTTGVLHTAYDLPTLGIRVILVESETHVVDETNNAGSTPTLLASKTEFVDVLVQPLAGNQA